MVRSHIQLSNINPLMSIGKKGHTYLNKPAGRYLLVQSQQWKQQNNM